MLTTRIDLRTDQAAAPITAAVAVDLAQGLDEQVGLAVGDGVGADLDAHQLPAPEAFDNGAHARLVLDF